MRRDRPRRRDPRRGLRADPLAALASGNLHVDLHGAKLRGRFVLVRRGRAGDWEQWLLLHKHDEFAVPGWDPEVYPRSVKSDLTDDELRASPASSWSGRAWWAAPTAEELVELDGLPAVGQQRVGDHNVPLTNVARVLHFRTTDLLTRPRCGDQRRAGRLTAPGGGSVRRAGVAAFRCWVIRLSRRGFRPPDGV